MAMFHGEDIEPPHKYKIGEIDNFYKGDPQQFVDKGYGITEESIKYFRTLRGKLGQVHQINIDDGREFDFELQCSAGTVLLSGVGCNYGGTGPHGTLKIIALLGLDPENYRHRVFGSSHVKIDLRGKMVYY